MSAACRLALLLEEMPLLALGAALPLLGVAVLRESRALPPAQWWRPVGQRRSLDDSRPPPDGSTLDVMRKRQGEGLGDREKKRDCAKCVAPLIVQDALSLPIRDKVDLPQP